MTSAGVVRPVEPGEHEGVTAADHTVARRLHDDVAERTQWLTYDLVV
jgi:hypothetical protein